MSEIIDVLERRFRKGEFRGQVLKGTVGGSLAVSHRRLVTTVREIAEAGELRDLPASPSGKLRRAIPVQIKNSLTQAISSNRDHGSWAIQLHGIGAPHVMFELERSAPREDRRKVDSWRVSDSVFRRKIFYTLDLVGFRGDEHRRKMLKNYYYNVPIERPGDLAIDYDFQVRRQDQHRKPPAAKKFSLPVAWFEGYGYQKLSRGCLGSIKKDKELARLFFPSYWKRLMSGLPGWGAMPNPVLGIMKWLTIGQFKLLVKSWRNPKLLDTAPPAGCVPTKFSTELQLRVYLHD